MTRTSDKGGVEYAVRRDVDGAWLHKGDEYEPGAWEPDADNASWRLTREAALELADAEELTLDDRPDALKDGYRLYERDWINEEDVDEDYEHPLPRPVAD